MDLGGRRSNISDTSSSMKAAKGLRRRPNGTLVLSGMVTK
jgi:hypothetical protein